ncbi:hypothetical protein [Paenibacillus cremeus]|uniref:hypothetical protein n=1 Tax=Paenibacillus cremeus TaxID=2163881 RepID=UPI0016471944|nr:hypothetical protein [Paenibacillus cremeus]
MEVQKETVTSVDPKTGESKEVTLVLDHDEHNNMKYSVDHEPDHEESNEGR